MNRSVLQKTGESLHYTAFELQKLFGGLTRLECGGGEKEACDRPLGQQRVLSLGVPFLRPVHLLPATHSKCSPLIHGATREGRATLEIV